MKKMIAIWMLAISALMSHVAAQAATTYYEEGYIDSTTTVADTTFAFYLNAGDYALDLVDWETPAPFLAGILGVSVSKASSSVATFFGAGSYSLSALESGLYTFYVFGNPYNSYGVGSFGLTVSAVPEPNTAALLVAGLALLGMYARRRSDRSKTLAVKN